MSGEAMMNSLTVHEQAELEQHEATIERGLQTFVEVGLALRAIRDKRLYRQNYATFEDYCRERWGWVASRARQLIAAAEVAKTVTMVTHTSEWPGGLSTPPRAGAERGGDDNHLEGDSSNDIGY